MKLLLIFGIYLCSILNSLAQNNNEKLTATIIGSGSPVYSTQRSGPSVLINYKNTYILVDMGNGTQANLAKLNIKARKLNGLLFTHHHLDHNEEFTPIFINSLLGNKQLTIAGPEPTSKYTSSILDLYNEDISYRLKRRKKTTEDISKKYKTTDLKGNEHFTIGEISISCAKVNHTIYTVAYRFEAGGQSIVISGDLTYSESLPILAKNADYLIIDSGVPSKNSTHKKPTKNKNNRERAHLNSDECGQMAQTAQVKNLVLTHFTKDVVDEKTITEVLKKNYSGTIIFGYDLLELK